MGVVFAFFDSLLAYSTGVVHGSDAFWIVGLGLGFWTLAGVAIGAAAALTGSRVLNAALLLVAPVVVQALRAGSASVPQLTLFGVTRWGPLFVIALGLALALRRGRSILDQGRLFFGLSVLSQGCAAFDLARRMTPPSDLIEAARGSLSIGLLVGLAPLGLALALLRGSKGPALGLAGLLAVSLGFAEVRGGSWQRPLEFEVNRGEPVPRSPSVLLITLDTLRVDHVSAYGYSRQTTPNLDALAKRSLLFERAYSPSPYTLGAHASLFTGSLPSEHGAHPVPFGAGVAQGSLQDYALAEASQTLAQELRRRGYRTGGIAANGAYLAPWTGLGRGFEHYDFNSSQLRFGYVPLAVPLAFRLSSALFQRLTYGPQWRANHITDAAIRWLERGSDRPFFLFLNYIDAHGPYEPPAPFDRRFGSAPAAPLPPFRELSPAVVRGQRVLTGPERAALAALYDGEILFMDAQLGRLFAWLDRAGRLDGMMVVITSDHGEFLGEHGLMEHGNGLYEEVLRVPLVVKFPGPQAGARVASVTRLTEVRDMVLAALEGSRRTPRESKPFVMAEHWTSQRLHDLNPTRFSSGWYRAVSDGRFKLIEGANQRELYDLLLDPAESHDRFAADPAAAALQSLALSSGLAPFPPPAHERPVQEADPAALERLRALGYAN